MSTPLLIGYVGTQALSLVAEEDAQALDIINIAFGHVGDGHRCVWDAGDAATHIARLRAIHPELKIVLSVGGWTSGGFSEAAATDETRAAFAESAAQIVRNFDLDGLDIDWEYPGIPAGGISSSPADTVNFTLYLQACRDALDALPGRLRTLSIAAGSGQYYVDHTEMDKVSQILDYVQIMTYDMRSNPRTGHHTNLYPPTSEDDPRSVTNSIEIFTRAGVPKEKIAIGAAFYSRIWRDVPQENDGYLQPTPDIGVHGPVYDELVADYFDNPDYAMHWDDVAKAAWLYNGTDFITYDDPRSLKLKAAYAKEEGLFGVMYWEYSCAHKNSLTQVLRQALDEN